VKRIENEFIDKAYRLRTACAYAWTIVAAIRKEKEQRDESIKRMRIKKSRKKENERDKRRETK